MREDHMPAIAEELSLRDYQREAIGALRELFGQGLKRIVLSSATGSGKTLTALAMVKAAIAKGRRVMFVCNRKTLVWQAKAVFEARGVECGVIQAENTGNLSAPCLVASVASLKTRGMPLDVGLVIFDECHFTPGSKLAVELVAKYSLVPVIGLTATPFSPLGMHVEDLRGPLFQGLVNVVTIRDLIERGYLCDVDIYAPSAPDMQGVKLKRGGYGKDFSDEDAAERMDTPKLTGDIVQHWFKLGGDKQTVVFACTIAHSKHICEQFQSAGVVAEHIDGYTEQEERQEIFRRFETGETRILCNVGVLCEGWDAPICEVMILARPTRSLIRYIQMAGRILRIHPGKERGLIVDHSGTVLELGFPTDDLPLELDDGKVSKSECEKEKREKLPKECPDCHFLKPAGVRQCPQCGHIPEFVKEVETMDGDLLPVKGGRKASMMDKADTYAGLIWYSRLKGYSPGWAAHKYREIFDVWPNKLKGINPEPASEQLMSWIRHTQIKHAKRKEKHATRQSSEPAQV